MCIACETRLDIAKQDAFGGRLLDMLNSGMTMLMVSLGHRSGLFDAMGDGLARTATRIARDAGLNERYVREWLGGMVASRIVEREVETDTYRLPLEHAASLCRASATGNMAIFAQYISILGAAEEPLLHAFRNGGGVPYSAYPRFHDVMEEDSGQSIVPVIAELVVPLMPGLHERLTAGIDVLDVGCGRGRALVRLAKTYPNSRFRGYDLSEAAVSRARDNASGEGLRNIHFEVRDLTRWNEPAAFDWIMALDAIHDQARPDLVLAAIRRALRPGGRFLMQDIDARTEHAENIDHPLGALLYGVSLMHCMPVSLAQDGMGLGAMWGNDLAERMLREAGFPDIAIHRFPHDVQNAYHVMNV